MSYRDACSCALIDAAVCSFGRHTCSFGPFDLQAPIRQRPDRLLEALRPHSVPSRAQRPCTPSESMRSTSNRTSRRPTGTAQCATGARQDRLSVSRLVSRLNTAAGKRRGWRFGGGRRLGAHGLCSLDLLLRACVSTHPRAHSRARLAHTWFDLILKERYLQRAIPMPGRRSCTYCRSGTPPRRAPSRAAAVAAIRRSNLPWKRATLLCSTYG